MTLLNSNPGEYMDFTHILVEKKDKIGVLTINRPDKLNALNSEVVKEIASGFEKLEKDSDIRVIVITGAGDKAFIAGADISEMQNMNPLQALEFAQRGQNMVRSIEKSDTIVIAALNGYTLGGGLELSMACDLRIASETAKMGQPEIKIGVIPGWGGTQRLTRLVGKTKAKELILTGNMIDADTAEKIGLINQTVPPDTLMDTVMKMAETIAGLGQFSLGAAKHAVDDGLEVEFEKAQELEQHFFALCFADPDQKEGMDAFLKKRKPEFS
jgi:enoyl-CoA hydratase